MNTSQKLPSQKLRAELGWVFAGTTAALAALDALALRVEVVGAWAPLIAAALFVGVPHWVLERWRKVSAHDAGLVWWSTPRKAFLWAGLSIVALLALFPVGFHIWHAEVLGLKAQPARVNYLRWSPQAEEHPGDLMRPGVYVWSEGPRLHVWCEEVPGAVVRLQSAPEQALVPERLRGEAPQPLFTDAWQMTCPKEGSRGGVDWTLTADAGPTSLNVTLRDAQAALYLSADPNPRTSLALEASWTWVLWLVLTQIVLVAIPEEFFYRGYIQPTLTRLWGDDRVWRVIVATSLLFAAGHVLVYWHWTRLMVFFPSLAFGWLRARTGGVYAPAMFHAACNCAVELARVHYV